VLHPGQLLPGDSTVSGSSIPAPVSGAPEPMLPVLVLVWSQEEPERVGELVCPLRSHGLEFTLGRAVDPDESGAFPLTFARLRPFSRDDTGPLRASRVSRRQLRVRLASDDGFVVERDASAVLRVNGHPVQSAAVRPGDLVEVERRFSLLVATRPRSWPRRDRPAGLVAFTFGQADPDGIVGESTAAWSLRERLLALAARDEHVLIHGPSGCGKELVARALHVRSRRGAAAWVARNAATVPESLIDAELFGNLKNYPNPGMPERPGLVGSANGSTLFLDEIGELPIAVQAHLLRVLDQGEYQRLGEAVARRADMRVVAATNRDPAQLKHDLLARFEHRLSIPGLDERRDDIPLLAQELVRTRTRVGGTPPRIGADLVHALVSRAFTTHMRELSEILLRSLTAESGPSLCPPPDVVAPPRPPPLETTDPELLTREQVLAALEGCGQVREQAWRALGLRNRYQFKRLLRRLAID
jgi:transcriptional regulator with AAA-type ATPase domain